MRDTQGVTYSLDDFSLPWRLVRHYAQMQLSTYQMAAGNPVMRAAIARHNAERMTSFLSRVELAGTAQFAYSNVHVVQVCMPPPHPCLSPGACPGLVSPKSDTH